MRFPIDVEKEVEITLYYLLDEGHAGKKTANAVSVSRFSMGVLL